MSWRRSCCFIAALQRRHSTQPQSLGWDANVTTVHSRACVCVSLLHCCFAMTFCQSHFLDAIVSVTAPCSTTLHTCEMYNNTLVTVTLQTLNNDSQACQRCSPVHSTTTVKRADDAHLSCQENERGPRQQQTGGHCWRQRVETLCSADVHR